MSSDELEPDLEPEELLLLREGYGALHPPSGKQDFILGALSVRLPGALVPAAVESGASEASNAAAEAGLGGANVAKLVLGGLVIGALGFGLGAVATRQDPAGTRALERAPAAAIASGARDLGAAPAVDGLTLQEEAEPVPSPTSATAPRAATSNSKLEAPADAAPTQVSFYEELSYVRRAQTALSGGNPALALGLMRSLRELRPDGALLAERGVTEVLALCALGRQGEAQDVADAVRKRGEGAVYATRLETTCAPGTPPEDSGDDASDSPTSTEQTSGRKK
jgi:hypothetical protein